MGIVTLPCVESLFEETRASASHTGDGLCNLREKQWINMRKGGNLSSALSGCFPGGGVGERARFGVPYAQQYNRRKQIELTRAQ